MLENLAGRTRSTGVAVLTLVLTGWLAVSAFGATRDETAEKVAKEVDRATPRARQDVDAGEERAALLAFQEDVSRYAEQHGVERALLRPSAPDTQTSAATQTALVLALRRERAGARRGDLFRPGVDPIFRRLVTAELEGPDTLGARRAVPGNPTEEVGAIQVLVRVNGDYPLGGPHSPVPAGLLATLPPLPPPLQYGFVGRHLILLDTVAGLIVDFLPGAAPDLSVPVGARQP